jgi:tetratricopeptide (TPR) repeat protein
MKPEIQGSDTLQNHLLRDRILADEIKLARELDEAMCVSDVCFGLSEEFAQPVNLQAGEQEQEFGNYLQKLHLRNHSFASKEVVHDLFSEVEEKDEMDELVMSAEDEMLFGELRDAVTEKDLIDLRSNLRSIAQCVTLQERTFEEIEDLASGDLDVELETLIKEEAMVNAALAREIALNGEIDEAIAEMDIVNLRNSLMNIAQNEINHSVRVISLASPKRKLMYWSAAASVIVLMAISALFQQKSFTDQELYASYFQPYNNGTSVSRSSSASASVLSEAIREINNGDYATALNLLKIVSADKSEGIAASFFTGQAYQALGDYKNAINSFTEVVRHGDNLLVEQSEWFIGLCYLRMNEKAKAVNQFNSIVASNGFYSKKSNELLKQIN